jgi:hypothetical protein
MMMMMADNITGVPFGQVPNQVQRPLISLPRQQTAGLGGFDVSKTPIANPNGGFTMPVTQLPRTEIPAAFGGLGGSNNPLQTAQILSTVSPMQATFGASTPNQYKFGASTTAQIYADQKGGGNVARDSALTFGGASGEVVTKAGKSYTG